MTTHLHGTTKLPNARPRSRLSPRSVAVGAVLGALVGGFHLGCAGETVGEELDVRQGAVGAFGAWTTVPTTGVTFSAAPAMAEGTGTTMTAFGNAGGIIWSARKSFIGNWLPWAQVPVSGNGFPDRVAAVGIRVTTGPLVGFFAVVTRYVDSLYYVRIQNQTGTSILQNWTPIGDAAFLGPPAIAYIPESSPTGPQNTLVIVGRGLDNFLYEIRNTLTGNVYSHANWVGPSFMANQPQTVDGDPALAYGCPHRADVASLVVAAPVPNIQHSQQKNFLTARFNGSTWSGWTVQSNGLFLHGPALSVACTVLGPETVLYGLGTDQRIWSGSLPSGLAGFSPIGSLVFAVHQPTAAGFGSTHQVTAFQKSGGGPGSVPTPPGVYTNRAQSP